MAVEGNRAGYRSEKAVKAIEGKAAAAMLEAGITGEGWGQLPLGIGQRLFGGLSGGRNEPARAELREAVVVMPVLTREDLLEEKARFAAAIRLCLEAPEKTWLTPVVTEEFSFENRAFDEKALEDVITTMICVRDDLEVEEAIDEPEMEDIFEELRQMNANVNTLTSLAAVASDYEAAERLKAELLGLSSGDEGSLMISLDQVVSDYEIAKAQQEAAAAREAEERTRAAAVAAEAERRTRAQAASQTPGAPPMNYSEVGSKIVDAVVDAEVVSDPSTPFFAGNFVDNFGDSVYGDIQGAEAVFVDNAESIRVIGADQVEILMGDEDLDDDYFDVKAAASVSDDEMSREIDDGDREPPIVFKFFLRTLDVIFFVAEKTLVAVPIIIDTSKTVSKRLEKENRNGLGKEGWEPLENIQEGRKRY